MRIRVRFAKTGPIRFVGHLDFMRTFQKIIKKSGLAAVYTGGFNPHMVLSFADPLGVGQESTGEYADIEFAYRDTAKLSDQELYRLTDIGLNNEELPLPPSRDEFLSALNSVSPEGVCFTDAVRVGLIKSSKAMALVRYASWDILLSDSFFCPDPANLLDRYLSQSEIVVHKVTKKSEKDVDIRPQILSLAAISPDEFPSFAEHPKYEKKRILRLMCESGSNGNLKPQTVMESLCAYANCLYDDSAYRLVRRELYDAERLPLLAGGSLF